jgi:hypothetical protein
MMMTTTMTTMTMTMTMTIKKMTPVEAELLEPAVSFSVSSGTPAPRARV